MFILSSTKLEIRAKQFLLGNEGIGEEGGGGGGQQGRNDPNIVCTYE
jgi:hypothetical protein